MTMWASALYSGEGVGAAVAAGDATYVDVSLPQQTRETKVVKDSTPDEIAAEIVEWIKS